MPDVVPVALEARGWGWRHGTRKAWAVRGLDLRIEAGERVLLLGPSGAGKSTLLAGVAGLLDPAESGGDEEGRLMVDGGPARQARTAGFRRGRPGGRAVTGLLLQDPQAQTVLARCGDDVAFGLENYAVPADQIWARVHAALSAVAFPYPVGHPTAALSGGERQRLALAGVTALRPGLLLLDEPTAMLDPDGADRVRRAVAAVLAQTGAGCLLVEHRVEPWLEVIDRVVVLAPGGGVQADGSPDRVFAEWGSSLLEAGVWVPGRRPSGAPVAGGAQRAAGEVLLSAAGLAVRRPGREDPVVEGVDLQVRAGRAGCVVGPNGAGKSTLALALAGLLRPAGGRLVAGPGLAGGLAPEPAGWRAGELVSRIGTVFQDPRHQFVAATVADELAVGPARLRGATRPDPAAVRDRTAVLLERLRLSHLARANPFTLSGGEQRRLSVATVLATAPRVLVLDEPTFGQDARTWAELAALLDELLVAGSAVVMATHDHDLVDLFGRPDRGCVFALGSADR